MRPLAATMQLLGWNRWFESFSDGSLIIQEEVCKVGQSVRLSREGPRE